MDRPTTAPSSAGRTPFMKSASLLELPVGDGPRRSPGPRRAGVQGTRSSAPTPCSSNAKSRSVDVLTGAERILALGRAGLPIVLIRRLVGPAPRRSARGHARRRGRRAARPRRADQGAAHDPTWRRPTPTSRRALASLGITPDVEHERLHRDDPAAGGRRRRPLLRRQRAARREPSAGAGDTGRLADLLAREDSVPLLLDAWTGAIVPVGLWERDGDRIRIQVDLLPGQSTVVALVPSRGPAALRGDCYKR